MKTREELFEEKKKEVMDWFVEETNKIHKQYPPRGILDETAHLQRALDEEFKKRAAEVREKYGPKSTSSEQDVTD